jgi:hypothetical protein
MMVRVNEYTIDEVRARVDLLLEGLKAEIARILGQVLNGGKTSVVAAVFERSDEKGVSVYRELGIGPTELPQTAGIVLAVPFERLLSASLKAGYKPMDQRARTHVAGTLRLVIFTLGMTVLQRVRVAPLVDGGDA